MDFLEEAKKELKPVKGALEKAEEVVNDINLEIKKKRLSRSWKPKN